MIVDTFEKCIHDYCAAQDFKIKPVITYDRDRDGYLVILEADPDWHVSAFVAATEMRVLTPGTLDSMFLLPMVESLRQAIFGVETELGCLAPGDLCEYNGKMHIVGQGASTCNVFLAGFNRCGNYYPQRTVVRRMKRTLVVTREGEGQYCSPNAFKECNGEVWLHTDCGMTNVRDGKRFRGDPDSPMTMLTYDLQ